MEFHTRSSLCLRSCLGDLCEATLLSLSRRPCRVSLLHSPNHIPSQPNPRCIRPHSQTGIVEYAQRKHLPPSLTSPHSEPLHQPPTSQPPPHPTTSSFTRTTTKGTREKGKEYTKSRHWKRINSKRRRTATARIEGGERKGGMEGEDPSPTSLGRAPALLQRCCRLTQHESSGVMT